jgi:hypothetical protein
MDRQIADWAADNPKLRASLDSLDAWIDSTMGYNAFAGAVGGYCPRPGAHLGARIGTGECGPPQDRGGFTFPVDSWVQKPKADGD